MQIFSIDNFIYGKIQKTLMCDTFFFPYITKGDEAFEDFIDIFIKKKFKSDVYFEKLNFLDPWKEGQNDNYRRASTTHFCFPVDLSLTLLYQSENYSKTLAVNVDHCNAKFLFLKEKNNNLKMGFFNTLIDDYITIMVGDERKDFLPTWCNYNKPNKTIIDIYDHYEKDIISSCEINDVFLPESPFQTNLIITKDCDEIHTFIFGKSKYKHTFRQVIENDESDVDRSYI